MLEKRRRRICAFAEEEKLQTLGGEDKDEERKGRKVAAKTKKVAGRGEKS